MGQELWRTKVGTSGWALGPGAPGRLRRGTSGAPTQDLEYSTLVHCQLPALSPLPSPISQTQNHELFCCWAANKNIMSAFQYLLAPACHRLGLGMCQSPGLSLRPGHPGGESLHVSLGPV